MKRIAHELIEIVGICILFVLALCAAVDANAQEAGDPPFTVTITVTPGAIPGDTYEAFLDGNSLGPVVPGDNEFVNLLPDFGTYTFTVTATNAFGIATSTPVVVPVLDERAPSPPGVNISVTCTDGEGATIPCPNGVTVTVN